MLKTFLIRVFGPLYSKAVYWLAYGPWGKFVHQRSIGIFKRLYKIEWKDTREFPKLGDFFLRRIPFWISPSPLLSPAESAIVDGPSPIRFGQKISVKGITYDWKAFKELDLEKFKNGIYWNFYLAPHNYHWVHSPADGSHLEGIFVPGLLWPVNNWGRRIAPLLYTANSRLSFRFESPVFGQVAVICVGALAVSSLHCEAGRVKTDTWTELASQVKKADRLLAFRLGSSVLLLLEKPPTSQLSSHLLVQVGESLIQES